MKLNQLLSFIIFLISILNLSNCAHYSLISTKTAPFKSIYIHNITNQSFAPNIHTLFQHQIRHTILTNNTLKISESPNESDVQLYITIKDYQRKSITRSSDDPGRFNSIDLTFSIIVSLYDNKTNSYLLKDIQLEANEPMFFNVSQNILGHREIEYQTLPKISRELSKDILDLIISDWSVTEN